jgi:hypothetical protein
VSRESCREVIEDLLLQIAHLAGDIGAHIRQLKELRIEFLQHRARLDRGAPPEEVYAAVVESTHKLNSGPTQQMA